MGRKADHFYYENFVEAAGYSCQAADYLVECLKNYDYSGITRMLETMHGFEHNADIKKHEMSSTLAKAFVTPLDREDLAELSQNIDEVADKIEEILQRFYVSQVKRVLPEAILMAEKIADCCRMMVEMLGELENFRKSDKLRSMIIQLNQAEEDCDAFYLDATVKIREQCGNDVLEIMAWKEIYDYMEDCADACEHVADTVEGVVMKNS